MPRLRLFLAATILLVAQDRAFAAIELPTLLIPGQFRVHPEKPKQTILGMGVEIQSDSIGSGNNGLPAEPIA
ncbi:MAG: hypothetical protein RLZZ50_1579, partial [Verrucomicrobiota bacterium]